MRKPVNNLLGRHPMRYKSLIIESARSGVIAALVMIPFALIFRLLNFRVGNYGPKFAMLIFGHSTPFILIILHLIIGCISALPLIWVLFLLKNRFPVVLIGAVYSIGYYVVTNSLALPWFFGDLTPWQLGFSVVFPSLFIHIVYGISIALTSRGFITNGHNIR